MNIKVRLAISLILSLFLAGCAGEASAAVERISDTIDNNVRVIDQSGREDSWHSFSESVTGTFPFLTVDINFARVLEPLEYMDFERADGRQETRNLIGRLNDDLSRMFALTPNLVVEARNFDAFDRFQRPSSMGNTNEITIQIGQFIRPPDKTLSINTDYGNLYVHSSFFRGRLGGRGDDDREWQLVFGLEESSQFTGNVIRIAVLDADGNITDAQNVGTSARLVIPLDSDIMRGTRYNAVQFIARRGDLQSDLQNAPRSDDEILGVLPRSFIHGNNLYVYFNRTGRFRLWETPHGRTENRENFLSDRGIHLLGDDDSPITRGDFYSALMNIHWIESLRYEHLHEVNTFPGIDNSTLNAQLHAGRSVGAIQGTGFGFFAPYQYLVRRDMFNMIAVNIYAFGFDIDDVMPRMPDVIGMPFALDIANFPESPSVEPDRPQDGLFRWHHNLSYLKGRSFVPYRWNEYEGAWDVAPDELVTMQEAREIIYRMIIARRD